MTDEEKMEMDSEKPGEAPEPPKKKKQKSKDESWEEEPKKKDKDEIEKTADEIGNEIDKAGKEIEKATKGSGPKLAGFSLIAGLISVAIISLWFVLNILGSIIAIIACLTWGFQCCFLFISFICMVAAIGLGIAALVMGAGTKKIAAIIGIILGALWFVILIVGIILGLIVGWVF